MYNLTTILPTKCYAENSTLDKAYAMTYYPAVFKN